MAEETSIVAFVPSAEAKAVTVALVPQKTSATLGDVVVLCGARGPQTPHGNMARQLLDVLPKSEKEKGKGTMPMTPANVRSVAKTAEKLEGQAPVGLAAIKNTKRARV